MALKIRLTRIGSRHQPHYRIVVAEIRSRRDGDPAEVLGSYNPRAKGDQVKLDLARVDYWLSRGAKPSDTLHSMIKRARRAAVAQAPAAQPDTIGAAPAQGAPPDPVSAAPAPAVQSDTVGVAPAQGASG